MASFGFRPDSADDLSDLIVPTSSAPFSSFPADEDQDFSTNPFADMQSSRAIYLPSAHSAFAVDDYHPAEVEATEDEEHGGASAFTRETAPTPESRTPSRRSSSGANSYPQHQPSSPLHPSQQTPFGSPPPLSPVSPRSPLTAFESPSASTPKQARRNSRPDMSALLGEEKPILPTYKRREPSASGTNAGGGTGAGKMLLPVSSLGNRTVAGPLAALLGMEDDSVPTPPTPSSVPAPASTSSAPSPIPPPALSALTKASVTPLPPSPSSSPPPPPTPTAAALSRAPSATASSASSVSIDGEGPAAYDTLVSPLDTDSANVASGPADVERGVEHLGERLAGLSAASSESGSGLDATSPRSEFRPVGFGDLVSPGFPAEDGAGRFRATAGGDDGASTKGTYSRSLREPEGEEAGETDSQREGETEREREWTVGAGGVERTDTMRSVDLDGDATSGRSGMPASPPLPAVPFSSTVTTAAVRSPERAPQASTAALAPSFVITVGDPQKIGSSLNVAAQHTVYTVRTQTTSAAFCKPEFSVLRRFSHFLWLFDALTLNNPGVIVPGMPEKNAIGRFGSEFVENRRSALQAALTKIVAHPMLVGDPDLRLFLESDSFSIKQRKIEAPAESKGFLASLGSSISGPKFQEFDQYFETRGAILEAFEAHLRPLLASLAGASKARAALQLSLSELQGAFTTLAQCDLSGPLRGALEEAGRVQQRLKELSELQSQSEERGGGLVSVAEGYARLCGSVKLVFGARIKSYHVWQAAESNLRKARIAHDRAKKAGRTHSETLGMSLAEISDAERRSLDAKEDFEDVSKLTKAEMARFDKEKIEDFKKAVVDYADGMVVRQREVVEIWQAYHEVLLNAAATNTSGPSALASVQGPSSLIST